MFTQQVTAKILLTICILFSCVDDELVGGGARGAPGACGEWSAWVCFGVPPACQAACGGFLIECGGLYGECRYGINGGYPDYATAPLQGSGCAMCQSVAEDEDWSQFIDEPDASLTP